MRITSWLSKLFSMPGYGDIPQKGVKALREVSPDPGEQLVAAIECAKRADADRLVTRDYEVAALGAEVPDSR